MRKGIAVTIIAAVVIGLWLINQKDEPLERPREAAPESLRHPPAGSLVGYADLHNTHAWRGIPFARAPIGELRWKAPRPPGTWQGTREALHVGAPCIQFWGGSAGVEGEPGELVGSEDCLTLSVWAPAIPADVPGDESLPVMVWIHGGGNTVGTGNTYNGHHLAGSQNVIVVSINYRLGVLGWFSHPALRDGAQNSEDASGNFALLDMIAALQWVKNNIAAFGGDPDKVTIFGESAGGRNVYALIASPHADGLFHRAIVQSGSVLTVERSWAENRDDESPRGAPNSSGNVVRALQSTGLLTAVDSASLRALTPEALHSTFEPVGFGMYSAPTNIRDGVVLPLQTTLQAFANGNGYNRVPMMLGTNRDESKVFMAQDPEWVSQRLGLFPKVKDQAKYDAVASLYSDQWKVLSVDVPARLLAANDGPAVFAYRFDWDETPANWLVDMPSLLGAGHALELGFVFGDFEGGISLPFLFNEDNRPGREKLSSVMMSYWAEFARTGKPGRAGGELPNWQAWTASSEMQMLFDTEADGGVRLISQPQSVTDLKERLAETRLLSGDERCRVYVELFLTGFQSRDFWDKGEYAELGCAERSPYQRVYDE